MNRSIEDQISHVLKSNYLSEIEMKSLCQQALVIVKAEQNVVYLNSPIVTCGNIRGQFQDLLEIFNLAGKIPEVNYLFMGDFMTHGFATLSCISLLLLYKVRYPSMVTLLRGRHETRAPCCEPKYFYKLLDQCKRVYRNEAIWDSIYDIVESLPLAAIINNEIFCQYGGVSRELNTIQKLQLVNRFVIEYYNHEGLNNFLTAEPIDRDDREWIPGFRDINVDYGQKATDNFLEMNKLSLILTCLQNLKRNKLGISYHHENRVISFTSSPNFLYSNQNLGAVIYIDDKSAFQVIEFEKSDYQEEEYHKYIKW